MQFGKALPVQVSHRFVAESVVFDDGNLVSSAGLVPVMTLAAQTGLSRLLEEKVRIAVPRITSGAANPSPKLTTVVAGMCAGADCIDDLDILRSGGMRRSSTACMHARRRNVVAGVHLRSRPPVGVGAT
jgi:hypothetical protein